MTYFVVKIGKLKNEETSSPSDVNFSAFVWAVNYSAVSVIGIAVNK